MIEIEALPARFIVYWNFTRSGPQYRWRLRFDTGETLAWSSTGYLEKAGCLKEIEFVKESYPAAIVRDLTLSP